MATRCIEDLPTPGLGLDLDAVDRNITKMAERWPGASLRPHLKTFKSTALAHHLTDRGRPAFCAATSREVEGLVAAGLGNDVPLANDVLDTDRLRALATEEQARVTVAVDSEATIDAALPGHCDPTVAKHEAFHVMRDGDGADVWPIDLRHW